uniref:Sushi domain-containing protein n=1 Tax=Hucho hucho TaxID=62062 RepID=A0A4W5JDU5_9TELE
HSLCVPELRSSVCGNIISVCVPELRSSACGNPGVPPKGILNGTQFNIGNTIRYRCVTGYVLDGHSLLTCVLNTGNMAIWDFPVPICREVCKRKHNHQPLCN